MKKLLAVEIRIYAESAHGVASALEEIQDRIKALNKVYDDICEMEDEKLPGEYIGFNVELLSDERTEDVYGNAFEGNEVSE